MDILDKRVLCNFLGFFGELFILVLIWGLG